MDRDRKCLGHEQIVRETERNYKINKLKRMQRMRQMLNEIDVEHSKWKLPVKDN
jgi:hypothetical protein